MVLRITTHRPYLSDVQEEALSCARDQVITARPPVLTPAPTSDVIGALL
jgi:hypothetical protein